jgi:hypothetical protein
MGRRCLCHSLLDYHQGYLGLLPFDPTATNLPVNVPSSDIEANAAHELDLPTHQQADHHVETDITAPYVAINISSANFSAPYSASTDHEEYVHAWT